MITTVEMQCPRCDAVVTAVVEPDGVVVPGEGEVRLALTDVAGCEHSDDLLHDWAFQDAAIEKGRSA